MMTIDFGAYRLNHGKILALRFVVIPNLIRDRHDDSGIFYETINI